MCVCVCVCVCVVPCVSSSAWIFTFVIFAWAAIYHSSVAGKREENPFAAYQNIFVIINSSVSLTLFALFALMSQSSLERQATLYEIGVAVIAIVNVLFAVFFIVYGILLVRSLTKDFKSPYARVRAHCLHNCEAINYACTKTCLCDDLFH